MRSHINGKIAITGVLLSLALILSYVESLISFDSVFPGIKLGLSNLAVITALFVSGPVYGLAICILKSLLTSLLFGSMTSFIYSICGALFSFAVMFLLYIIGGFHIPVISVAGGIFHNLGQFIAAVYITKTFIPGFYLFYVAILLAAGSISGAITGFIANLCVPKIKKIISKEGES